MPRPKSPWEQHYLAVQSAINDYARALWQPRLRQTERFQIYHPDEYRRYLRQHPCRDCRAECFCNTPCPVYLQWYNARMKAAALLFCGAKQQ